MPPTQGLWVVHTATATMQGRRQLARSEGSARLQERDFVRVIVDSAAGLYLGCGV
jgi:hypothetical protein